MTLFMNFSGFHPNLYVCFSTEIPSYKRQRKFARGTTGRARAAIEELEKSITAKIAIIRSKELWGTESNGQKYNPYSHRHCWVFGI